jgi:uridine phosphorylase
VVSHSTRRPVADEAFGLNLEPSYPNFPGKHAQPPLYSAEEYVDYLHAQGVISGAPVPPSILLLFDDRHYEDVVAGHAIADVVATPRPCHVLTRFDGSVGVVGGFGIGGPRVALVVETLAVLGARRYVAVGTAGALDAGLRVGDIVVCDAAIRDEGASHHYVAPARYAFASRALTEALSTALEELVGRCTVGASWTTDAPFRETVAEVEAYTAEGVCTVDMEAATLFAVAEHRGAEAGAALVVSDVVTPREWIPGMRSLETAAGLRAATEAALTALAGAQTVDIARAR